MVKISPEQTYDFSHLYSTQKMEVMENGIPVFSVVIGKIPHGAKADAQSQMLGGMNINLKKVEKNAIDSALATGMQNTINNGQFDVAKSNDITNLYAIVSWTLKDKDGQVVDICIEAWRALPDDWTEQIEVVIEGLNPELDSEFQS